MFFHILYSKCYELGEFKNVVNYMNMQAEKILERFFRLVQMIPIYSGFRCLGIVCVCMHLCVWVSSNIGMSGYFISVCCSLCMYVFDCIYVTVNLYNQVICILPESFM